MNERECEWHGPHCVGLPYNARRHQRFCRPCAADGNGAMNSALKRGTTFEAERAKRLAVAGSQAAVAPSSAASPATLRRPPRPPDPDDPPHDPNLPVEDPTCHYQSHACARMDLMSAALVYARAALSDGYEVTVLRDGECAVVRLRASHGGGVQSTAQSSPTGQRMPTDGQSLDFGGSR